MKNINMLCLQIKHLQMKHFAKCIIYAIFNVSAIQAKLGVENPKYIKKKPHEKELFFVYK